jgi:predicted RNA methylase
VKVTDDVLLVLTNCTTDGTGLVLPEQLDRKLYLSTNKVLEAAGGKWNRKAKAHIFDGDAADAIEQVVLRGEVTTFSDLGYYPTPRWLADQVMHHTGIREGHRVLEPSAGTGAGLAAAALRRGATVDVMEIDEKRARMCVGKGFNKVRRCDFLKQHPSPTYDRIVMNPPFAKQQDISHVIHAMSFLKPDGWLVAIMSAGVGFRENRKTVEFRELIDDRGYLRPLPEDAFKESGTTVRTVLVVIGAEAAEIEEVA